MESELGNVIQEIYPLPKDVLDDVLSHFQELEYPKHYFLLKQGKVCNYLWFMQKGLIRHFYVNDEGKEINTWFAIDQQVITDTPSFVNKTPSSENIQLLEDSKFFAITNTAVQSLLIKHHSFALWYIRLVELHYVTQIEDRVADLQFLDAKQRYEKLLDQTPDINNRVSLKHIASYLNITQETLSRIRAGKA